MFTERFGRDISFNNRATQFLKMARALKQDDVLEVSKLFEEEFNKPDLHDRVLIFDVVVPRSFSSVNAEDDQRPANETTTQSEDGKKDEAEILGTGMNINHAKKTQSQYNNDYFEIPLKYENVTLIIYL